TDDLYSVIPPQGATVEGMKFTEVEELSKDQLWLPELGTALVSDDDPFLPIRNNVAFKTTPGAYRLLTPHQDPQFVSDGPFFFEDPSRTFLVTPKRLKKQQEVEHPDPLQLSEKKELYFQAAAEKLDTLVVISAGLDWRYREELDTAVKKKDAPPRYY